MFTEHHIIHTCWELVAISQIIKMKFWPIIYNYLGSSSIKSEQTLNVFIKRVGTLFAVNEENVVEQYFLLVVRRIFILHGWKF